VAPRYHPRTLADVLATIGFLIFLVIAHVGVRVFRPPLATIWPLIAGCITFGLVMSWKLLS
jgi:hypothetical protein